MGRRAPALGFGDARVQALAGALCTTVLAVTGIPGKYRYRLTGDGPRFAIFCTKLHDRLLRPLLAADQPTAPPPLRKALRTMDTHIAERIHNARLPLKAA
jgi:hypothetical protein